MCFERSPTRHFALEIGGHHIAPDGRLNMKYNQPSREKEKYTTQGHKAVLAITR